MEYNNLDIVLEELDNTINNMDNTSNESFEALESYLDNMMSENSFEVVTEMFEDIIVMEADTNGNGIIAKLKKAFQWLKNKFLQVVNAIWTGIKKIFNAIKNFFTKKRKTKKERIKELEDEIEKLKKENKNLESDRDDLDVNNMQSRYKNDELKKKNSNLSSENERLRSENDKYRKENSSLKEDKEKISEELKQAKNTSKGFEKLWSKAENTLKYYRSYEFDNLVFEDLTEELPTESMYMLYLYLSESTIKNMVGDLVVITREIKDDVSSSIQDGKQFDATSAERNKSLIEKMHELFSRNEMPSKMQNVIRDAIKNDMLINPNAVKLIKNGMTMLEESNDDVINTTKKYISNMEKALNTIDPNDKESINNIQREIKNANYIISNYSGFVSYTLSKFNKMLSAVNTATAIYQKHLK